MANSGDGGPRAGVLYGIRPLFSYWSDTQVSFVKWPQMPPKLLQFQTSHDHWSWQEEGKKRRRIFLFRKIPRICTYHFHGHLRGHNLVTWTHPAPKYTWEYYLYSCHPYVCLKFGEFNTTKEERMIIFSFSGSYNINRIAEACINKFVHKGNLGREAPTMVSMRHKDGTMRHKVSVHDWALPGHFSRQKLPSVSRMLLLFYVFCQR